MRMSLIDEIIVGIHNLKTLEIRTIIGPWHEEWDEGRKEKHITPTTEAKTILTQIDLLDGDITTAFSEDFLTPPLDKIREYHAEREKQGHAVIEANLKALTGLMNLLVLAIQNHADAKQADRIEEENKKNTALLPNPTGTELPGGMGR
jgi:hypothetical protein